MRMENRRVEGLEVLDEFVEAETGKDRMLPQLPASLNAAIFQKLRGCRQAGRLVPRHSVRSGIMAQHVPFLGAVLGRDADPFMLHLYAALARRLMSERTRQALAAKKASGPRLGNPHNLSEAARSDGLRNVHWRTSLPSTSRRSSPLFERRYHSLEAINSSS